jgi:hypothetical protein
VNNLNNDQLVAMQGNFDEVEDLRAFHKGLQALLIRWTDLKDKPNGEGGGAFKKLKLATPVKK